MPHDIDAICSGQPDELNLLEDGLALWLVALRCAPAPCPELLALFPNLTAALERSTGGSLGHSHQPCCCSPLHVRELPWGLLLRIHAFLPTTKCATKLLHRVFRA